MKHLESSRLAHWLTSCKRQMGAHRWWSLTAGVLLLALVVFVAGQLTGNVRGVGMGTAASSGATMATDSTTSMASQTQSTDSAAGTPSEMKGAATSGSGLLAPTGSRMVIEQASLNLAVVQPDNTASQIGHMGELAGGFVEAMQSNDTTNNVSVSMTLRIPESRFTDFVNHVRSLGQVTNFSQTGQDVTDQYNGLQDTLTELQSEATAYTRLFSKAQSMQDMLQIQQSLVQVNDQIAQVNEQMHGLRRSVQLATLTVVLTAKNAVHPGGVLAGPFMGSVQLLGRTLAGLVRLVAWLLPWAMLAGIGAGIWIAWSRRRH